MTYSLDLRERAVSYVRSGGRQSEASRIFAVTTRTLYGWLRCGDLSPKRCGPRRGKLDKTALAAHVQAHPDALLRERAAVFGVSSVAIFKALRQMQFTKKNDALR
jgi:putative transposase